MPLGRAFDLPIHPGSDARPIFSLFSQFHPPAQSFILAHMPWNRPFAKVDGTERPRFIQEDGFDCGLACLAMVDARLGLFVFSGVQTSASAYVTDVGYKYFISRINLKKDLFIKHEKFKKAIDFSKEGLTSFQLRMLFLSYGIRCKTSTGGPFVGANIDALQSASYKRPIVAIVRRTTGGQHFVVVDGFTSDEKYLIVTDPDPNTDTANTCLCTGIDYERGGGSGKAPPYNFGTDHVGEFTGDYLFGFEKRTDYGKSGKVRE